MREENVVPNDSSGKKELTPAQVASQLTCELQGHLKNVQLAYLRVAKMLAEIRDRKRYADLDFKDMETYAEKRLHLGRSSLYAYLKVYEWVKRCHPAWLEDHPKGFIPNLCNAVDLMWIEEELAKKDLDPDREKTLTALQKKAEDGQLEKKELKAVQRRNTKPSNGLRLFLSALRALRKRGAKLTFVPAEVIQLLDQAIGILENKQTLQVAGFDVLEDRSAEATGPEIA
jgi:hypothetical protein